MKCPTLNKIFSTIEQKQPNRTIRLVDGPNVNEGIVQLLELGRWQSVCTNSRNWTQADLEVACRQLGFQGGEWVYWYPHLNDTNQILYQDPGKTFNRRGNLGIICLIFFLQKLDFRVVTGLR